MKSQPLILLAVLAAGGAAAYLWLGSGHSSTGLHSHAEEKDHDHEQQESAHTEEQSTTIQPDMAKAAGIVVETAGPAYIGERVALRGKIILNPETTAEVKARFPGVVKSVRKMIGDNVKKGETLATVESNDSLQTYAVISPLSGVVMARTANVGDTAAEQPIFTVANLATVTAHLHVFPQDLGRVRTGQNVLVQSVDGTVEGEGKVTALLPVADADTQTVQAWAVLDNAHGRWLSGMAVQAGAAVSQGHVPVAVKSSAIQTLEGKPVVFVKTEETYTAHPVKLGKSDETYTEVLEGLAPGSSYVSKNSFIIKADIGKSAAAHAH